MDPKPAALPPPWATILALRPVPAVPRSARSLFLWGPHAVHAVALRTAARAVAAGHSVAVIDGGHAFQIAPFVAMAKACRVAPERFLRRVHLVRAFTCWQFTTLLCERLEPLLSAHPIGLVVLLDPLTHFFDEEVTFKESKTLFTRVLNGVTAVHDRGPRLLIVQTVPGYQTPRRRFAGDLLRAVDVGMRLAAAGRPWSVEVVKPKGPPST